MAASLTARMREREIKGREMEKTGPLERLQTARNVTKMFLFSGMIEKRQEAGIMASELGAANYDETVDKQWLGQLGEFGR